MRDRNGPKTGEVRAIFGLPSFRPEWALWGITYPTFQIASITSNKGTCEPVPRNLVTANKISPSGFTGYLTLLPQHALYVSAHSVFPFPFYCSFGSRFHFIASYFIIYFSFMFHFYFIVLFCHIFIFHVKWINIFKSNIYSSICEQLCSSIWKIILICINITSWCIDISLTMRDFLVIWFNYYLHFNKYMIVFFYYAWRSMFDTLTFVFGHKNNYFYTHGRLFFIYI
jgi:hypothetical protein